MPYIVKNVKGPVIPQPDRRLEYAAYDLEKQQQHHTDAVYGLTDEVKDLQPEVSNLSDTITELKEAIKELKDALDNRKE